MPAAVAWSGLRRKNSSRNASTRSEKPDTWTPGGRATRRGGEKPDGGPPGGRGTGRAAAPPSGAVSVARKRGDTPAPSSARRYDRDMPSPWAKPVTLEGRIVRVEPMAPRHLDDLAAVA